MAIEDVKPIITNDHLPVIKGYETEIRLLFQNLISNAIKFRKPGAIPVIHIGCKDTPAEWTFCVKDNGIGIDHKYLKKIFQIFQKLHLSSEYEGSGIGLAHCAKIVELHGGKIWVESAPGKGSTFYFSLPLGGPDEGGGTEVAS